MKYLIFLTFSFKLFAQIDIVFDIDWTIVSHIDDANSVKDQSRIYKSLDQYYRLTDGTQEIIEDLLKNKNIRISFYSGGSEIRNLDLLRQIKLSNGQSLLDISYKVLSKKHLLIESSDLNLRFSERYKKDLTLINKDLGNIILVDDIKHFTPASQKDNVLWLGETFKFQEDFKAVNMDRFAETELAWIKDRYKLFSAYDKINNSIKMMRTQNISFKKAVNFSPSHPIKAINKLKKRFPHLKTIKSSMDCMLLFGI